jgi:hypothetical protein
LSTVEQNTVTRKQKIEKKYNEIKGLAAVKMAKTVLVQQDSAHTSQFTLRVC